MTSIVHDRYVRENYPVPQEGGWELEWPYIHKDMVCVCVWWGNHPVPQGGGGGGRVLLPPWPARTIGKPQNRRSDILFHRGGGGRGRIHHDIHYLLKYKST